MAAKEKKIKRRRRQWGADRKANPMPAVPRTVGDWTMALGRGAVVITVAAWLGLVATVVNNQVLNSGSSRASTLQTIVFLLVVSLLAASATAYLVARLGFYYRARRHRRVPRAMLDDFYATTTRTLTALVPSYQEEPGVISMTLLSAALQEYPDIRVVLLIDDPPDPRYAKPHRLLESARSLPGEIEALLSGPRGRFDTALARYMATFDANQPVGAAEIRTLAEEYQYASGWIAALSEGYEPSDHNEQFFAVHVLGQLSQDLRLTAAALRGAAAGDSTRLSADRLAHLYRRLAWTFRAEVSSFERKRYVSLSAEANKATNLNSYIGLIGGRYRDVQTPAGRTLVPAGDREADLVVPECDYILTLDADSVILPEYCLRLVYLLEQSEHRRVAVAQSPYSSFPGSATRLERIAGATTDLQHIIHQGMTFYGASFWVGANAVLRKKALDAIVETEYVGGWPIRRYISDRTVIEDTESTIDLAAHGWTMHNYPERLAYSATPPDFGSLCIQRHRWANGGLLIIPKLARCVRQRRWRDERTTVGELFLRLNYMGSIFWSSLSVLFLLAFQFDGHLLSPLTFLAAVPYFIAMAMDLRYCGYKTLDVFRVYGFNLLLLPVNLAGSVSSVVQGLTGAKGRFIRTPKVKNRTVPALIYVLLPYLLVALSVYTFKHAYDHRLWGDAVFAAVNAVLATYAIVAFVGIRHSLLDVWSNVVSYLHKPQKFEPTPSRRDSAPAISPVTELEDWELVLYLGFAERRRQPRSTGPGVPAPPVALPPVAPPPVSTSTHRLQEAFGQRPDSRTPDAWHPDYGLLGSWYADQSTRPADGSSIEEN
jgi:cellulose synthase/poly-beta-1,6-N-acetylglucosamine synthase-like glycosyltransferase